MNQRAFPQHDGFQEPGYDPAWEALRHTGDDVRPIPKPQQWKRWGEQKSETRTFTAAGAVTIEFPQFLSAEFHHPTGWLLGFQLSVQSGATLFESAVFSGHVIIGLGSGRFPGDFALGTIDGTARLPKLVVVGPYPAETLIVSGTVVVTPAVSVPFPYTSVITFGAFVAPQVWQ